MGSSHLPTVTVRAVRDSRMSARVVRQLPLYYAAGADRALDRPAHVRAASGLAWAGDKLAVIQDDANFIAMVDVVSGQVDALTLPAGVSGSRLFDIERGNKSDKQDLESLISSTLADGTPALIAFGSGSTLQREHIVIVSLAPGAMPQVVHAPELYSALRTCRAFAGSELNVEGAVRQGDCVRLFGRGNGDESAHVPRMSTSCDLHWNALLKYLDSPSTTLPPVPTNIIQYELGHLEGIRITFTDAAEFAGVSKPALLYVGTAEASADVVVDGPVEGSVLGMMSGSLNEPGVRYTEIRNVAGERLPAKVEGVAVGDVARGQVFVVVDADNHRQASELWELEVKGFLDERAPVLLGSTAPFEQQTSGLECETQ
jgi:hypothetical protein